MAEHPFDNDKEAELEKGETRRPYCTPQLKELGDLRGLTLSGSPGVTDSDGISGEPWEY